MLYNVNNTYNEDMYTISLLEDVDVLLSYIDNNTITDRIEYNLAYNYCNSLIEQYITTGNDEYIDMIVLDEIMDLSKLSDKRLLISRDKAVHHWFRMDEKAQKAERNSSPNQEFLQSRAEKALDHFHAIELELTKRGYNTISIDGQTYRPLDKDLIKTRLSLDSNLHFPGEKKDFLKHYKFSNEDEVKFPTSLITLPKDRESRAAIIKAEKQSFRSQQPQSKNIPIILPDGTETRISLEELKNLKQSGEIEDNGQGRIKRIIKSQPPQPQPSVVNTDRGQGKDQKEKEQEKKTNNVVNNNRGQETSKGFSTKAKIGMGLGAAALAAGGALYLGHAINKYGEKQKDLYQELLKDPKEGSILAKRTELAMNKLEKKFNNLSSEKAKYVVSTPVRMSSKADMENYVRRLEQLAEHKPKSWIGKKIAALRSLYSNYLNKARAAHSINQAGIFQNIARIILNCIDWLMNKLQHIAG